MICSRLNNLSCLLIILMNLYMSAACNGIPDYKEGIIQMRTDSIVLPLNEMNCILKGNDTMFFNNTRDWKYVVYSDTSSCSYCDLGKVLKWKKILRKADEYSDNLNFYFIFYPSQEKSYKLNFHLRTLKIPIPVYVDTLGLLERLNPHLPQEQIFHTFLLDENNNVLLVGNPLENKKIEKMFWQIVEEHFGKRE